MIKREADAQAALSLIFDFQYVKIQTIDTSDLLLPGACVSVKLRNAFLHSKVIDSPLQFDQIKKLCMSYISVQNRLSVMVDFSFFKGLKAITLTDINNYPLMIFQDLDLENLVICNVSCPIILQKVSSCSARIQDAFVFSLKYPSEDPLRQLIAHGWRKLDDRFAGKQINNANIFDQCERTDILLEGSDDLLPRIFQLFDAQSAADLLIVEHELQSESKNGKRDNWLDKDSIGKEIVIHDAEELLFYRSQYERHEISLNSVSFTLNNTSFDVAALREFSPPPVDQLK